MKVSSLLRKGTQSTIAFQIGIQTEATPVQLNCLKLLIQISPVYLTLLNDDFIIYCFLYAFINIPWCWLVTVWNLKEMLHIFFIAFCQETVLMFFFFLKVGYSSDFLHFNILI